MGYRVAGWLELFADCRQCPPAGNGYPKGAAKKQGETASLLGWSHGEGYYFVSGGLVGRKSGGRAWPRCDDGGLLAAVTPAARDGGGWCLVGLDIRKPLPMRPNKDSDYLLSYKRAYIFRVTFLLGALMVLPQIT